VASARARQHACGIMHGGPGAHAVLR
jgi:hypothetical protein